jgi:hypothetical protein
LDEIMAKFDEAQAMDADEARRFAIRILDLYLDADLEHQHRG